jgi:hypothetical protein
VDVEAVTRTIQLVLAPVVMVTACAIVLGVLQSRYAFVNDRLRTMSRERLELLHLPGAPTLTLPASADAFTVERLELIDRQVPDLLRRHLILRNAILSVYCAIVTFLATMFVIALATTLGTALLATTVLVSFLVGTVLVLVGVSLTTVEVRASHLALHYEVNRVMGLGK